MPSLASAHSICNTYKLKPATVLAPEPAQAPSVPLQSEVQSKEAHADDFSGPNVLQRLGYFRGLLQQSRGFAGLAL